MTRSRDFSRILGRSIANNTFTTTGSISASGGVTAHDYTTVEDFVDAEANAAALEDGSLHYLTKLRKMYVWDDSDASFYLLGQQDSALEKPTPHYQGQTRGYTSGGSTTTSPPWPITNAIEKFSFAASASGSDVGDLTTTRRSHAGASSSTHGYASGGNVIDKFPFATDGNATDVGDEIHRKNASAGGAKRGNSSTTHGYSHGGYGGSSPTQPAPGTFDSKGIEKFSFSTDADAAHVGYLHTGVYGHGSANSDTHGYAVRGGPSAKNNIQKFSFSTDGNATDVGDATVTSRRQAADNLGSSSHGYIAGGQGRNVIEKFSFSTDGNGTDVGDLASNRGGTSGSSSTEHGYVTAGFTNSSPTFYPSNVNSIERFPYATDENSSDVGDLTSARGNHAGHQF